MTPTEAGFERDLRLFVPSEIDDYGLDPYEFRIYARIVRRAGRGDAWESIPKMAKACQISESRTRSTLQLLEAVGLIESQERPGYSKLRRLKPKQEWTHPETLEAVRQSLTLTKSDTSSKSDRGGKADTPSKSDTGVVAEVIRLPLSKVTDECIPIEGNPVKAFPSLPPNPHEEKSGREEENLSLDPGGTIHSLASLHDELSLAGDEQIASGEGSSPAVTFSPTQITAITKNSSTPTPIPAAAAIEPSCSLQPLKAADERKCSDTRLLSPPAQTTRTATPGFVRATAECSPTAGQTKCSVSSSPVTQLPEPDYATCADSSPANSPAAQPRSSQAPV